MSLTVQSAGGGKGLDLKDFTAINLHTVDPDLKSGDKAYIELEAKIKSNSATEHLDNHNICRVSENVFIMIGRRIASIPLKIDTENDAIINGTAVALGSGTGVNGEDYAFKTSENHFVHIPSGSIAKINYFKIDPETLEITKIAEITEGVPNFSEYSNYGSVAKIREGVFVITSSRGWILLVKCDPVNETFTAKLYNSDTISSSSAALLPLAQDKMACMARFKSGSYYYINFHLITYDVTTDELEFSVPTSLSNNIGKYSGYAQNGYIRAFDQNHLLFLGSTPILFNVNDNGEITIIKKLTERLTPSYDYNDHVAIEDMYDIGYHFECGNKKYITCDNSVIELNITNSEMTIYKQKYIRYGANLLSEYHIVNQSSLLHDNFLYRVIGEYISSEQTAAQVTCDSLNGESFSATVPYIGGYHPKCSALVSVNNKVYIIISNKRLIPLHFNAKKPFISFDKRCNGYYDGEKGRVI